MLSCAAVQEGQTTPPITSQLRPLRFKRRDQSDRRASWLTAAVSHSYFHNVRADGTPPFADGNSQKNYLNQPKVVANICDQLASGAAHTRAITGIMIESHINAGRQDVPAEGPSALKHGISITDACVPWETTVEMLDALNTVRDSYVQ
jgi:hypothetical protein